MLLLYLSQQGFPGFGTGLHGLMYTIYDPNEMVKVVRSEGAYPSGIVEKLWQWRRAMRESGSVSGAIICGLFIRQITSFRCQKTYKSLIRLTLAGIGYQER